MEKRQQEILKLLEELNVMCRDNGKNFLEEESPRLEVIKEKLKNTAYKCQEAPLFLLYHKKQWSEYGEDTLLISTHIDCAYPYMSQCFSKIIAENELLGTYDNSITNTAVLQLMLEDKLPDNVIVAFTGDEERQSKGAINVTAFLRKKKIAFKCIVLDVTDNGWQEEAAFTLENNFWKKAFGKKVMVLMVNNANNWSFVSSDPDAVPKYIPAEKVICDPWSNSPIEAEPDESWDYDEENIQCFSLCLPVNGDMHSNAGLKARIGSFLAYIDALESLANM